MRSLLLASAALIVSTGLACAQTSMSAPAPTGAPNTPMETSPGASPGNTAPSGSATQGSMSAPSSTTTGSTSMPTPAPNGSTNAPAETMPGTSPGKTAPTNSQSQMSPPSTDQSAMSSGSTGMMHHKHHHMMGMKNGSMASDGSAGMYLHAAKMAIHEHNKMKADDALSHAETRLLTRSVPQSSAGMADDSPAITSIESARKAVKSGDMMQASSDVDMAMHQMHDKMGKSPMSSGSMSQ